MDRTTLPTPPRSISPVSVPARRRPKTSTMTTVSNSSFLLRASVLRLSLMKMTTARRTARSIVTLTPPP